MNDLTPVERGRVLNQVRNEIMTRLQLGNAMGQSYGGKRDFYVSCGYPKTLTFEEMQNQYDREDIAHTIITAYPEECWSEDPQILDDDNPDAQTAFEKAWSDLENGLSLNHVMFRADKLAGIGKYGAILLGFDGSEKTEEEPRKNAKLIYVRPLTEGNCLIDKYEKDTSNPRFGKPLQYRVKLVSESGSTVSETHAREVTEILVHWKRIVHIAEGPEENDLFGTPRLQRVYNRFFDTRKILASAGESFWQQINPSRFFKVDADSEIADRTEIDDEIQKMIHGLQRYMVLQGVDAKDLGGSVNDPTPNLMAQIDMICAYTRIPKRILLGSERGELSSSQDERAFKKRASTRRERFITPMIIRNTVDRLIEVGTLPKPKNGEYWVEWPEGSDLTEKDQIETAKGRTSAMKEYVAGGVEALITPEDFLVDVLGFDKEKVTEWMENLEKYADEKDEEPEQPETPEKPGASTGKEDGSDDAE